MNREEMIRKICVRNHYSAEYMGYWIQHKWCEVCGADTTEPPHHIKTRGAGGQDNQENLIELCREHHIEVHKIGRETFAKKYGIGRADD